MTHRSAPFDVLAQIGPLRRYARSLARNEADAEDLVQDALLRAYEKRGTFQTGQNLKVWLMSILHNLFVSQWRRGKVEASRLAHVQALAEPAAPPAQDHAVRLTQIREAFLGLSDEQRAALHLVAIDGLSYQEAADSLGVPLGTLMSRLGRARAALRMMEEQGTGSAPVRLRIVGGSDESA